ncbi:hypothetical protein E2C01_075965 [Portunus trituberculatus]|uniref:Uncharacterized protein n=1 Tax=Portunus trituberculatus TaxID=210409 RepID=A0A5B7ILZ1_PORTR|nr:hypothetical protein [Portunus trituberculatus]
MCHSGPGDGVTAGRRKHVFSRFWFPKTTVYVGVGVGVCESLVEVVRYGDPPGVGAAGVQVITTPTAE